MFQMYYLFHKNYFWQQNEVWHQYDFNITEHAQIALPSGAATRGLSTLLQ